MPFEAPSPHRPFAFWFACVLTIAACGGAATEEQNSDQSSGQATSGDDDDWEDWDDDEQPEVESNHGAIEALGITPPEDKTWEEMTAEEREWYMIGKVLPIMKEVFAEHDPERFTPATYGCATCHGDTGEADGYAMPLASSYPVPEAGTPAYGTMQQIFGDMVTFMEDRVTPVMGTLVGNEEYTCHNCHPSAQ